MAKVFNTPKNRQKFMDLIKSKLAEIAEKCGVCSYEDSGESLIEDICTKLEKDGINVNYDANIENESWECGSGDKYSSRNLTTKLTWEGIDIYAVVAESRSGAYHSDYFYSTDINTFELFSEFEYKGKPKVQYSTTLQNMKIDFLAGSQEVVVLKNDKKYHYKNLETALKELYDPSLTA